MRKRVIKPAAGEVATADQEWLDVEQLAQVEVTSEDAAHPVEAALVPGDGAGWFIEPDTTRTQEFVLRWSPDGGRSFREIVRQPWNFGPPERIREAEDYGVELSGVTVLELVIVPDKSRGEARASLARCRLAG